MSDEVRIALTVDATQAEMSITEIQNKVDEMTREAAIARNTVLRMVREGFTMISQLMSAFRQAMSVFGQAIDPFFSALIGMVLATASMLISAATVFAMTGIGGAIAVVVFSLAVGFQIVTLGKLIADKQATDDIFGSMIQAISKTGTKRAWGFS